MFRCVVAAMMVMASVGASPAKDEFWTVIARLPAIGKIACRDGTTSEVALEAICTLMPERSKLDIRLGFDCPKIGNWIEVSKLPTHNSGVFGPMSFGLRGAKFYYNHDDPSVVVEQLFKPGIFSLNIVHRKKHSTDSHATTASFHSINPTAALAPVLSACGEN